MVKRVADPQAVVLPKVLEISRAADETLLELYIPNDLAYFPGHFPKLSVVPGVVQIHWAVYFGQRELTLQGDFSQMEAVKFSSIILADTRLCLELKHNRVQAKLNFRYFNEQRQYGTGRLYFRTEHV